MESILWCPPPNARKYLGLEFSGVVEEPQDDSNRVKVGDEVYSLTNGGRLATLKVYSDMLT